MTHPRGKPHAIVVGSGLNGLGVVRSLAPEAVPVTLIDTAPGGPAVNSRFVQKRALIKDQSTLVDEIIKQATGKRETPVLILTQEAAVAAVSAARAQLRGRVRYDFVEHETVLDLMDKTRFHTRAQALGFPVPQSVAFTPGDDLKPVEALTYPCILKPIAKNAEWDRRNFKKAYRFDNFEDLARFAAELKGASETVIIQEWIEGGDSDVFFTLLYRERHGTVPASFTGRKIRQWPPLVGGTASCMPAPEHKDELAALTARFFAATAFVGLASMEYKRDRRSGRFVMVEPTVGRTDYQEEVATLNGVNIVRAAYRSLAGLEPLKANGAAPKRVWRDGASDAKSLSQQPTAVNPPEAAAARIVDATFRWSDPGPVLADFAGRIAARFS
jgi:D-aspartate ligase